MSDYRLISWNTQGNAMGKVSTNSGALLSNDRFNILLVQEAGPENAFMKIDNYIHTFGRSSFRYSIAEQQDAVNKRCSVGFFAELVEERYRGIVTVQPQISRRPIIYADLLNYKTQARLRIATLHATSGNPPSAAREVNATIDECLNVNGVTHWILMGDFNMVPEYTRDHCNLRGGVIVSSGQATQQSSRNELDYAITSPNMGMVMTAGNYMTSDHRPVFIDFSFDAQFQ